MRKDGKQSKRIKKNQTKTFCFSKKSDIILVEKQRGIFNEKNIKFKFIDDTMCYIDRL